MKSIEVSARTIEEAVSAGLSKLGCSIADCKVEIIQEGAKGLFGVFGSKPATVRLTPLVIDDLGMGNLGIDLQSTLEASAQPQRSARDRKPKAPVETREKVPEKREKATVQASKEREKPAQGKNRMRIAKEPQVVDKPRNQGAIERFMNAPLPGKGAGAQAPKPTAAKATAAKAPVVKEPAAKTAQAEPREKPAKPQRQRTQRPPRVVQEGDQTGENRSTEPHTPVPAPENIVVHGAETQEGIAQTFLLEVTKRMGVSVQVDVRRDDDGHLFATMYGDTLGILIGRRGETLDALQYLTSLQVNRGNEDYTRITLDTENYRAKREEALVRLASRMAGRAVKTGRKVSLEPMNPYERRILHASLQNNANVTTHSEGDEPYRHVVVVPSRKGNAQQA